MKIAYIGQKGVAIGSRGGGIEKHVGELAVRMAAKGHDVTVYARKAYTKDHKVELPGVEIKFVPTLYRKNLEAIIHTFLSVMHALTQKYDIVHMHGVGPATLAWMPRVFRPQTRVVVTFHAQDRLHKKWGWVARKYLHFGEWASVRFPHVCIAVSHVLQVMIRDTYKRQVVYIPNGAEIHDVTSTARLKQFGLTKNGYLLNVGRIIPVKGLQYLIEAYKRLGTKKQLVIVGAPSFSDRYYKELQRLAKDNDNIKFLGYQKGKELEQLYAHAYLYVQPSESEGLPVVVLEAMSFGKAVLVSDIPQNIEVIRNTGFTFSNKDTDDLEGQLRRLLNDPGAVQEYGERARELVRKQFSWDAIAEETESVYISTRH